MRWLAAPGFDDKANDRGRPLLARGGRPDASLRIAIRPMRAAVAITTSPERWRGRAGSLMDASILATALS
jgi:hypothetical protein